MLLIIDLDLIAALHLQHIAHILDGEWRNSGAKKPIDGKDRLYDVDINIKPADGPDEAEVLQNVHDELSVLLSPELLLTRDLYLEDLHWVHLSPPAAPRRGAQHLLPQCTGHTWEPSP